MSKFFTSESVTEGHPDKMADQISDAILDAILKEDPTVNILNMYVSDNTAIIEWFDVLHEAIANTWAKRLGQMNKIYTELYEKGAKGKWVDHIKNIWLP